MTYYTDQNRHQNSSAREKQAKLMTETMFQAIEQGDESLFDLTVQKGANLSEKTPQGYTVLHVAFRRACLDRSPKWLDKVLPYVDDLFVGEVNGRSVFDTATSLRNYFNPNASGTVDSYMGVLRRHLMQQMPNVRSLPQQEETVQTTPALDLSSDDATPSAQTGATTPPPPAVSPPSPPVRPPEV